MWELIFCSLLKKPPNFLSFLCCFYSFSIMSPSWTTLLHFHCHAVEQTNIWQYANNDWICFRWVWLLSPWQLCASLCSLCSWEDVASWVWECGSQWPRETLPPCHHPFPPCLQPTSSSRWGPSSWWLAVWGVSELSKRAVLCCWP